MIIESAGVTDVGRKRSGNEDALFLDDEHGLYVVSDGMGGHLAGEVASRLVIETIQQYMRRFDGSGGHDDGEPEQLADTDTNLSVTANRLLASIRLANRAVYDVSQQRDECRGMGATASAVCFDGRTFVAANVGDSPIYFIHRGRIETISVPHTVLAEQEALHPGSAENLGESFRHMLTRSVGVHELVQADVSEMSCFAGDRLVLCSDGLSDKVSADEIGMVATTRRPAEACRHLVELANERGGDDNITVIVLAVRSASGLSGLRWRLGHALRGLFGGA